MKIGSNIKEIREKEKEVPMEDVAKALGITLEAYSDIENNVTDLTLTRLGEIAKILGCSPVYIFNYKEKEVYFINNFNNHEGNQGVNVVYQGVDAEQIQEFLEQIVKLQEQISKLKSLLTQSVEKK